MRLRTDGIRRTKFRQIFIKEQKGHLRGIFWAHNPYEARWFAKNMRSLGFAAKIRRVSNDQHINYVIGNWRHV